MNEYNVCGVLVMARPEKGVLVERTLNQMDGVAVHARDGDGRLVVTVEGPLGRQCADTISELSQIDGVVSTSLVYHEIDNDQHQQESAQ